MSISDYFENKILDHMLRGTAFTPPSAVYVSLHTADPGETGTNEVTGGGYARQQVTFNAPSAGSMTNSNLLRWNSMPAVTVTHVGLWDAASAGNPLWFGPLSSSVTLSAGSAFEIAAGSLTVTID
jgi:hypothetical protein